MTFAELASATGTVAGEGPPGEWFRASAVGRLFGGQFTAQRAVIVRAPAESTALGRLIDELAEEDAIHDREVRFGVGLLNVIAEHHWHPEIRVDAAMLYALLFPDGAALVNKSYPEEAGPRRPRRPSAPRIAAPRAPRRRRAPRIAGPRSPRRHGVPRIAGPRSPRRPTAPRITTSASPSDSRAAHRTHRRHPSLRKPHLLRTPTSSQPFAPPPHGAMQPTTQGRSTILLREDVLTKNSSPF